MVLAVNWPPQAPAPGQARSSSSCRSAAVISPRHGRDRLEDILNRHVAIAEPPGSIDPPYRTSDGRSSRASAIAVRGSSCRIRPGRRRVEQMPARHQLDRIGDHLAADERRLHPSVPIEMPSETAMVLNRPACRRGADPFLHLGREVAQVDVARHHFDPGVGDADQRPLQVVVGVTDRLQHGARRGRSGPSVMAAEGRLSVMRVRL